MKKCNSGVSTAVAAQYSGEKNALAAGEQKEKYIRFNELIKGEFKEVYDEYVQSILRERLGKLNEVAEKYEKLAPALEMLSDNCGVDAQDAETVANVIMEKFSGEGEAMRDKRRRETAEKRYDNWLCQSGEAHALYPEFDLTKELENEEFKALLKSSIPVKTAYEFVHREEFLEKAMDAFEKDILKKAFAGALRPREAALNSSCGTRMCPDVASMSKNTRQEIIRRVQQGERISF